MSGNGSALRQKPCCGVLDAIATGASGVGDVLVATTATNAIPFKSLRRILILPDYRHLLMGFCLITMNRI
jgi:hypothetical protein